MSKKPIWNCPREHNSSLSNRVNKKISYFYNTLQGFTEFYSSERKNRKKRDYGDSKGGILTLKFEWSNLKKLINQGENCFKKVK